MIVPLFHVTCHMLQDSCSFAASVRDYKHYLDSTPTPADAPQVKLELEKVQRARKAEQKGNLQRTIHHFTVLNLNPLLHDYNFILKKHFLIQNVFFFVRLFKIFNVKSTS